MRTLLLAVALAVTAQGAVLAGPSGPPGGRPCFFVSVQDPDDSQQGAVYGGPLVAPGADVSITCTIQVGGPRHDDPDTVTATAGPARDAVVLAPHAIAYPSTFDPVYVCTEAVVDGTTWYRSGDTWTQDPASDCAQAYSTADPPPHCFSLAECLVDPVLCLALVALSPLGVADVREDGDVYLPGGTWIWDCPPYGG